MKKTLKMIGMTALLSLSCLTMTAQLNGSGFYRVRNAANTNHYISLSNDLFNYHTVISNAGGGLTQLYLYQAAKNRAMACAGLYLQTDIHMVDDSEFINPGAVIYAEQKVANGQYNLIGQGTSLLTLTTGTYAGNATLTFENLYIKIASSSGSGANTQYTASMVLKASNNSMANLGTRYFVDNNGTFAVSESSSASNAKWYIDPVDHFNVVPELEFNGKYYTTLYVPYAFTLSGQVLNAYAIKAVEDSTLNYELVATAGGTVPAGTPVLLECASANPADCQLIPAGVPLYTTPNVNVTDGGAPRATNATNYTGTNILKGTYFCNTDGSLTYQTNGGTSSFNANNNAGNTNPQKYVIGFTDSGKLAFVKATTTPMPANKAWLEAFGEFPSAATPVITPASGTYTGVQTITITGENGAVIHYTTDGTTPTATSPVYTAPFTASETMSIKAIAVKEGLYNISDVAISEVVIAIPDPVLTVNPTSLNINEQGDTFTVNGSYLGTDDVGVTSDVFSTTTSDQTWGFENNNGTVDGTVTVTYQGRELNATGTVNVANNKISKQVTVNYQTDIYIVTDNGVTDQWNFNEGTMMTNEDGVYTATFTTTADSTFILFTKKLGNDVTWGTRYVFGPDSDGDWVMPNQATEYGNIDVNDDDPIKLPYAGEYTITINGNDKTFSITRKIETVATPTFSPEPGTYSAAQTVEINCTTPGATIMYKIGDGEYQVYTDSFVVNENCTITAYAIKDGWNQSGEVTANYVIEIPVTHKPGDVNHDGLVDINDVTILIDYVLGKPSEVCNICADVIDDNLIDINDVTAIIDIVLGKQPR